MAKKRGFFGWLLGVEPGHPLLQEQPAATAPEPAPAAPPKAHGPLPEENPCMMCGGSDFRWGWLESGLYGTGTGAPAQQPKFVKQKTRFGDFIGLRARLCTRCRHVAIFARPDEDDEE